MKPGYRKDPRFNHKVMEFHATWLASHLKTMLEEVLKIDPEAVINLESIDDECYAAIDYYEEFTPEEYEEARIEEELELESKTEEEIMSDVMLMGVLRMPPEIWGDGVIDMCQRYSRYIEAADRIEAQEVEIKRLRAYADALVDRAAEIIGTYKVPVGNSCAGEMAAEWTMDALHEVWQKIKLLKYPDAHNNAEEIAVEWTAKALHEEWKREVLHEEWKANHLKSPDAV